MSEPLSEQQVAVWHAFAERIVAKSRKCGATRDWGYRLAVGLCAACTEIKRLARLKGKQPDE